MIYESNLGLNDLRERYPDPPRELFVGTPPLIHHGYSLGRLVVCIKACQEAMQEAKSKGDQAAIAHLQKHLQAFQQHTKEGKEFSLQQDAASRRRGNSTAAVTPPASPVNAQ